MINLFVTHTVKPHQLYRLVLLFTVTVLMYVGSTAQKYVDIRTDVCARIEKRNNGNGQYGNCAGIGGNAIAENVIGTSFATIVRNKGINKLIPASIAANRFVIRFKPASTLPVDMLEVKATKKENGALISWKVANEEKIQHYEVEESADAKDFLLMAKVAANNSQQSVKVYEAFDKALFTGNNYYRIKSVAADGNFRYSPVVKLLHHTITNPSVSVYPNPVKDNKISLALNNLPEGNYNIVIADQKGAVLYSRQLKLNTSNSVEIITVPGSVKAGSYILSVTGENVKETRQIIFE